MKIARVFPRKTKATPNDELSFFEGPPMGLNSIDEVHISVTFTEDRQKGEYLAYQWESVGVPVKVGGPAYDDRGDEFEPGLYVKSGYVMTSRGCNNHCWFCMVPKREGPIRELEIKDGFNVLDSNLLQCSDAHFTAVCEMLKRQSEYPLLTGGLEAKTLKPWHCKKLREIKTKRAYFAYDTPDDLEPLINAGKIMMEAGFTKESKTLCCYCLIGYKGDTFEKAETRLRQAIKAGFVPYAMLYRDEYGKVDQEWSRFQRHWIRPETVNREIQKEWKIERTR